MRYALSKIGFAFDRWVWDKAREFYDHPRQLRHHPARRLPLPLLRLLEGKDKPWVVYISYSQDRDRTQSGLR